MKPRQAILVLVLIATLAAAFWPADEPEFSAVVEPARRAAPAVAAAPAVPVAAPAPAAPRFGPTMAADLFPAQTWAPPPPPPVPPPPPPPPAPPPLPYKYLGRWIEAGRETVFLATGNAVVGVHGGETLAGGWRLDEVARGRLVFTYLPLNLQRTLGTAP